MVAEEGGIAVESGPVPRSTLRLLVANTTPHEPTAARSWPDEPTVTSLLHFRVPAESKTARNVSALDGSVPPPRSTWPAYSAVRMPTPSAFVSKLPKMKRDPVPPKFFVQSRFPAESKRARARELVPELDSGPPPKSIVPGINNRERQ